MDMNKDEQLRKATQINAEAHHFLMTDDHQKAMQLYLKNVAIFAELEDFQSQAKTLNNVGLIEAGMGLNDDAISHFRQALDLFERLGSTLHVAEMWGNIGSTYRNMEDYDAAMGAYSEALPLYESLNHKQGVADQYTNMAYAYSMLGELEEAIELYQKALPLYTESGDSRRIDATKQNIQNLLSAMGKDSQ